MSEHDYQPDKPPDDNEQVPLVLIQRRRQATLKDAAWGLAAAVAINLAVAAFCALVVAACWNGLVDLTELPTIEWREAFAAVLLLRVAGLIVRF